MGKSKIIYDGRTLIDLTSVTVTADTLLEGITAHGADGEAILGILQKAAGGGIEVVTGSVTFTEKDDYFSVSSKLGIDGNYAMFVFLETEYDYSQTAGREILQAGGAAVWDGITHYSARYSDSRGYYSTTSAWNIKDASIGTHYSTHISGPYVTINNTTKLISFAKGTYQWIFIKEISDS